MKRRTTSRPIRLAIIALALSLASPVSSAGARVVDTNGIFLGVSCASPQFCVTVGLRTLTSGNRAPIANVGSGQSWQYTQPAIPDASKTADLWDVSCPSATWCVAVGSYTLSGRGQRAQPLVETFDGQQWTVRTQALGPNAVLDHVSCPSTAFCMAGGIVPGSDDYGVTERWDGTSWQSAGSVGYGSIEDLDCGSARRCAAASLFGPRPRLSLWNGTQWTDSTTSTFRNKTYVVSVSCSVPICMTAGGDLNQNPITVKYNGTRWLNTSPVASQTSLTHVSCQTASSCLALGYRRDAQGTPCCPIGFQWDGTGWTVAAAPAQLIDAAGDLDCRWADACVDVGDTSPGDPAIQVRIDGVWMDGGAQPPMGEGS